MKESHLNRNERRIFTPFLFLSMMGLFAIFSSTMSKSPTLTLFAISLGASDPEIGLIAAASTVPGIVASLPFGFLSDVYGRRKVILLSAFLFAFSPFLYFLVQTPLHLALVRLVHGFATAIFGPVSVALIADLFQSRRGEKMAVFSSITLVGRLMAPFIGGILLTLTNSNFHTVYFVCGVSGLLALLAATMIKPAKTVAVSVKARSLSLMVKEGLSEILSEHRILTASGVEAAQLFAYGAVEAFIPKYCSQVLTLPDWQIGAVLTIEVAALMLTKPFMGRMSDKVGRRLPIIAGLSAGAVSLFSIFLAKDGLTLALVLVFFGIAMAAVTASTSPLVADLSKEKSYGSAIGLLDTIMDVGQTLGPITFGLLLPVFYYYVSFALVGLLLLAFSFIFAAAVR
jgi:MFS family permease